MTTFDELFEQHLDAIALKKSHVPISVGYTISVLNELKEKWSKSYPTFGEILESKIAGLTASLDPDDLKDVRFGL